MLRRLLCIATAACALAGGVLTPGAGAVTLPAGFVTNTELTGLTRPSRIAWAPDGRRFVAEKDGVLKVAPQGSATPRQILDIRDEVGSFNDRGLLGMALDTDFEINGYVYLLFTYDVNRDVPDLRDTSAPAVSQLRRYTIDANSQVVPGSLQVLLGSHVSGACPAPSNDIDCIPADGDSHSIGTVISAPDGSLFVGNGDGAGYNTTDPLSLRTYDEQSLAGKIMHIDREGRGLPQHPFCPSEANLDRVCTKLFAKGFRNPFRFSLLASGALLVGDVGWGAYEEINVISAGGQSYGWPCYEGPSRTGTWSDMTACQAEYAKEGSANAHVAPTYSYPHTAAHRGWAVIAGPQYTGTAYPSEYRGTVFFGDYGAGFLKRLSLDPVGQPPAVTEFATGWRSVDLTSAPNGDITWVNLAEWVARAGFVERLVYSPGNARPTAVAAADPRNGPIPLTVEFDAAESSDGDDDPLSYDWDFGDGSEPGSGTQATHTYHSAGTYTATLTVSDGRGLSNTDTVQINASNTPPVPTIDLPAAGFEYNDGAPLTVRGSADDAEQGSLPATAFEWNVRLVHGDHEHLLTSPSGVREFELTPARDHGADSYYVIALTVTDALGATVGVEREMHPETVPLHLRSSPAGAPLSFAGASVTAPWDRDEAIGFTGTVSAAQMFTTGGIEREFVAWSNGGTRVHDLTIPAEETTLTATYNAKPAALATTAADSVRAGSALSFDGSGSSDADDDELTYSWDFGDGTASSTEVAPTHTYVTPGAYAVTLTVADNVGGTSRDELAISVTPPASGLEPDLEGPRLTARLLARARPRRLAGTVSDAAGVEVVKFALARVRDGRCRWATRSPLRLAQRARPCSPRVWVDAAVVGNRWSLTLPARLPAGRYRTWLLARDRLGNLTRHTVAGRGQLRFRVRTLANSPTCTGPLLRQPLRCGQLTSG